MSRCVRRSLAAAACVIASVIVLGSCNLGFLGTSFTLEGQVYGVDKVGLDALAWDADVTLAMAPSTELFYGSVVDGILSVGVGTPDSVDLGTWESILPPASSGWSISDPASKGCVINQVVIDILDPVVTREAEYSNRTGANPDGTVFVYWAYTDADVTVSGSGPYSGPGGVAATMTMDLRLKAGWNLVILTREGDGTYTDTYKVGKLPDGLNWVLIPT